MNIGNNIKQLRQKNNLTQDQVAEKIGVSIKQFQSGKIMLIRPILHCYPKLRICLAFPLVHCFRMILQPVQSFNPL